VAVTGLVILLWRGVSKSASGMQKYAAVIFLACLFIVLISALI
jgi:hypothetical protein